MVIGQIANPANQSLNIKDRRLASLLSFSVSLFLLLSFSPSLSFPQRNVNANASTATLVQAFCIVHACIMNLK